MNCHHRAVLTSSPPPAHFVTPIHEGNAAAAGSLDDDDNDSIVTFYCAVGKETTEDLQKIAHSFNIQSGDRLQVQWLLPWDGVSTTRYGWREASVLLDRSGDSAKRILCYEPSPDSGFPDPYEDHVLLDGLDKVVSTISQKELTFRIMTDEADAYMGDSHEGGESDWDVTSIGICDSTKSDTIPSPGDRSEKSKPSAKRFKKQLRTADRTYMLRPRRVNCASKECLRNKRPRSCNGISHVFEDALLCMDDEVNRMIDQFLDKPTRSTLPSNCLTNRVSPTDKKLADIERTNASKTSRFHIDHAIVKHHNLTIRPGDRLEVYWTIKPVCGPSICHWWRATVLNEGVVRLPVSRSNRSISQSSDICTLSYDPFPQGGFPEPSNEDVIFKGADVLMSLSNMIDLRYRLLHEDPSRWLDDSGVEQMLEEILGHSSEDNKCSVSDRESVACEYDKSPESIYPNDQTSPAAGISDHAVDKLCSVPINESSSGLAMQNDRSMMRVEVLRQFHRNGMVHEHWWSASVLGSNDDPENGPSVRILEYDPLPEEGMSTSSREVSIFNGSKVVSCTSNTEHTYRMLPVAPEKKTEPSTTKLTSNTVKTSSRKLLETKANLLHANKASTRRLIPTVSRYPRRKCYVDDAKNACLPSHSSRSPRVAAASKTWIHVGDRLEVEWQIGFEGASMTHWWGATLVSEDSSKQGKTYCTLEYDPFPEGNFPESSRERVVFKSKEKLLSFSINKNLKYRKLHEDPEMWRGINDIEPMFEPFIFDSFDRTYVDETVEDQSNAYKTVEDQSNVDETVEESYGVEGENLLKSIDSSGPVARCPSSSSKLRSGERLEVEWQLSIHGVRLKHWWSAVFLEDNVRTLRDGRVVSRLSYEPFVLAGFPEQSIEEVVFDTNMTLMNCSSKEKLKYRAVKENCSALFDE